MEDREVELDHWLVRMLGPVVGHFIAQSYTYIIHAIRSVIEFQVSAFNSVLRLILKCLYAHVYTPCLSHSHLAVQHSHTNTHSTHSTIPSIFISHLSRHIQIVVAFPTNSPILSALSFEDPDKDARPSMSLYVYAY